MTTPALIEEGEVTEDSPQNTLEGFLSQLPNEDRMRSLILKNWKLASEIYKHIQGDLITGMTNPADALKLVIQSIFATIIINIVKADFEDVESSYLNDLLSKYYDELEVDFPKLYEKFMDRGIFVRARQSTLDYLKRN